MLGRSIGQGSSAEQISLILNAGYAGQALRANINATLPFVDCTLLMAVACRPQDDDETIRVAETLVRYGARLDQGDNKINSCAVCVAADFGKPKFLKWLVDQGARIDRHPNVSPTMPIGLAVEKNHMECVAVLAKAAIRAPRDPERFNTLDSPSIHGNTPAFVALE